MVGFQQPVLGIEKEKEFQALKDAMDRALSSGKIAAFLKRVRSNGLRVRSMEAVLAKGILEKVDETLAKSGSTGLGLYRSLTLSDQGQIRELYLSRIEEVDPALRAKFQKLYRYY